MDWDAFFAKTIELAGETSNHSLAKRLGIAQAAISHYRTGKRTPPPHTVAACLRLQGHPDPEKETARLMVQVVHTSQERAFWRKLGAAAALALCAVALTAFAPVSTTYAGEFSALHLTYATVVTIILLLVRAAGPTFTGINPAGRTRTP